MTKIEKIIYDAIPFDGAFSEIVKGESAKAIASAVLPLIEEAFEAGARDEYYNGIFNPGADTDLTGDFMVHKSQWLSSNITGEASLNNESPNSKESDFIGNSDWHAAPKKKEPLEDRLNRLADKIKNKESVTGPVVGIPDDTPFDNRR